MGYYRRLSMPMQKTQKPKKALAHGSSFDFHRCAPIMGLSLCSSGSTFILAYIDACQMATLFAVFCCWCCCFFPVGCWCVLMTSNIRDTQNFKRIIGLFCLNFNWQACWRTHAALDFGHLCVCVFFFANSFSHSHSFISGVCVRRTCIKSIYIETNK